MQIQEIMTPHPACCTPATRLKEVARMMVVNHCGAIPVVDSLVTLKPVGIITDRDIVCRSVAEDKNPLQLTVQECMSSPVVSVHPQTRLEDCCRIMEDNRIRRVPVVDEQGRLCGIVAQGDIARRAPGLEVVDLLKEVSQPTETASLVAG